MNDDGNNLNLCNDIVNKDSDYFNQEQEKNTKTIIDCNNTNNNDFSFKVPEIKPNDNSSKSICESNYIKDVIEEVEYESSFKNLNIIKTMGTSLIKNQIDLKQQLVKLQIQLLLNSSFDNRINALESKNLDQFEDLQMLKKVLKKNHSELINESKNNSLPPIKENCEEVNNFLDDSMIVCNLKRKEMTKMERDFKSKKDKKINTSHIPLSIALLSQVKSNNSNKKLINHYYFNNKSIDDNHYHKYNGAIKPSRNEIINNNPFLNVGENDSYKNRIENVNKINKASARKNNTNNFGKEKVKNYSFEESNIIFNTIKETYEKTLKRSLSKYRFMSKDKINFEKSIKRNYSSNVNSYLIENKLNLKNSISSNFKFNIIENPQQLLKQKSKMIKNKNSINERNNNSNFTKEELNGNILRKETEISKNSSRYDSNFVKKLKFEESSNIKDVFDKKTYYEENDIENKSIISNESNLEKNQNTIDNIGKIENNEAKLNQKRNSIEDNKENLDNTNKEKNTDDKVNSKTSNFTNIKSNNNNDDNFKRKNSLQAKRSSIKESGSTSNQVYNKYVKNIIKDKNFLSSSSLIKFSKDKNVNNVFNENDPSEIPKNLRSLVMNMIEYNLILSKNINCERSDMSKNENKNQKDPSLWKSSFLKEIESNNNANNNTDNKINNNNNNNQIQNDFNAENENQINININIIHNNNENTKDNESLNSNANVKETKNNENLLKNEESIDKINIKNEKNMNEDYCINPTENKCRNINSNLNPEDAKSKRSDNSVKYEITINNKICKNTSPIEQNIIINTATSKDNTNNLNSYGNISSNDASANKENKINNSNNINDLEENKDFDENKSTPINENISPINNINVIIKSNSDIITDGGEIEKSVKSKSNLKAKDKKEKISKSIKYYNTEGNDGYCNQNIEKEVYDVNNKANKKPFCNKSFLSSGSSNKKLNTEENYSKSYNFDFNLSLEDLSKISKENTQISSFVNGVFSKFKNNDEENNGKDNNYKLVNLKVTQWFDNCLNKNK